MRFLFTTLAADGHFNPLVPLARAVQAAGHTVAFACAESYGAVVRANGFECFPMGQDLPAAAWPGLFPEIASLKGDSRAEFMRSRVFAGVLARSSVPDLIALAESWAPDVLVRERGEFAACVAAEALGRPHAVVQVGAYFDPRTVAAPIAELRAAAGLPPDPNLAMLHRYLHLSFVPPSFQDPALPVPPTTHALRPDFYDTTGDERLPGWVKQLPGRPTVYATLGTIANKRTEILAQIIAGLRDEPFNVIVTTGRDQDPAQFGPQPDTVHLERYIPQTLLLPYCDLVIAHGGFSTVLAALSFGLPLVVTPVTADQPANARRCQALGVAQVVPGETLTAAQVRAAVHAVLNDPAYRQMAQAMQQEMQALPGYEHAVHLLERLAVEKQPLYDMSVR